MKHAKIQNICTFLASTGFSCAQYKMIGASACVLSHFFSDSAHTPGLYTSTQVHLQKHEVVVGDIMNLMHAMGQMYHLRVVRMNQTTKTLQLTTATASERVRVGVPELHVSSKSVYIAHFNLQYGVVLAVARKRTSRRGKKTGRSPSCPITCPSFAMRILGQMLGFAKSLHWSSSQEADSKEAEAPIHHVLCWPWS